MNTAVRPLRFVGSNSAPRPSRIGLTLKSPTVDAFSSLSGGSSCSATPRYHLRLNLCALCFHGLTKSFSRNSRVFTTICVATRVSPAAPSTPSFSPRRPQPAGANLPTPVTPVACGLFISLASLLRRRAVYFQSFADSFGKTRGVVGCPSFPRLCATRCVLPTS